MVLKFHRWIGLLAVVLLMLPALVVAAQTDPSSRIVSPQAGESLFGLVSIIGTASNPNMQRYTLEFDLQDTETEQWFPIAGPITQQVANGVLGQWNTTTVPDGRYQIRLRIVLRDGTVIDSVVQNLRVSNRQPTPLPTVQPSATPLQPTLPPSPGPSPTPIIQQPPTNTPRALPTAIPVAAQPASPSDSVPGVAVLFDSLQTAFCNGVYVALGIFLLVALYSLISRRFRPLVRRLISQIRNNE